MPRASETPWIETSFRSGTSGFQPRVAGLLRSTATTRPFLAPSVVWRKSVSPRTGPREVLSEPTMTSTFTNSPVRAQRSRSTAQRSFVLVPVA